MGSLVIVALPAKDDYVHKISSEKIPHLTILFLGEDSSKVENVADILNFTKHAADTTLTRFGMEVDRREVLGENEADVLFFAKTRWSGYAAMRDFRANLLKDDNIRKAYDSSEQFPEWLPHLTLGYPDTPAKPDERDYPGISYVNFDRIAVWLDDYEGIEFPLKAYEWDAMEVVEDVLTHFGRRGMKWGVRNTQEGSGSTGKLSRGEKRLEKAERKFDKTFTSKSKTNNLKVVLHNSIGPVVQSKTNRLNASPKYAKAISSGRLRDANDPISKQYVKDYNKIYMTEMNGFLKGYQSPKGKTVKAELNSQDFLGFSLKVQNARGARKIKHADEVLIRVNYIKDEAGRIINFEIAEDELTQSAMTVENILAHVGVKGMKWGVRNARNNSSAVTAVDKKKKIKTYGGKGISAHPEAIRVRSIGQVAKKSGTKALSNKDLEEYNKRLNLEQNYKRLSYQDKNPGQKFVASLLGQTGKTQAQNVANDVAAVKVKKHITSKLIKG